MADPGADATTAHETWNTCPECFSKWKDAELTPGVVHRTKLCEACIPHLNNSPKFDRFGYSGADYDGD